MAVSINTERKGVEVSWDASLSKRRNVVLRFTRDNDISETMEVKNDGLALVSYPAHFSGTSYVEVMTKNGKVFDSGEITVN